MLAHLAASSVPSRGRRWPEPEPQGRTGFQRDRDRIVHATAFRKLLYKTQVFVNHEGDLFRTRLTHSLEVAQIARSVARRLCLQEDLTEAICLAHDLGHTPFGHAGQHALNRAVRAADPDGEGFEHNLQSLRVVDQLEQRYAEFDGLNLSFETREGILKHCTTRSARSLGPVAERFLTGGSPTLEAQLANLADEVAYNHHDLDDGLRSGLLSFDAVMALDLVRETHDRVRQRYPRIAPDRLVPEMIRAMINQQVDDITAETQRRVRAAGVSTLDEVRAAPGLVAFSEPLAQQVHGVKRFLHQSLYRHPRVMAMTEVAEQVVADLFAHEHARRAERQPGSEAARAAADCVAGLTDREARQLHDQWFPGRVSWPGSLWPAIDQPSGR